MIAKHIILSGAALAAAMATMGCSFHARGPIDYRDDTTALLTTREAAMKSCYEQIIVKQPQAAGLVTVQFIMQEETGELRDPSVDAARTTAPPEVQQCVMTALEGLTLKPPDQREGQATYTFEFEPQQPAS